MSIIMPSRDGARPSATPLGQLFSSPPPAGRKITAGFTYMQRIGKGAAFDVWFPDALKKALDARIAAGQRLGAEQFPAEWAAVRQFELLQEAGNYKIYDLDPTQLQRATLDLSRSMRAGGYRVTVATLGSYREQTAGDDLEILDRRLQRRISQMIQMLYLDQQSEQADAENDAKLAANQWNYVTDLPHVGMVLGAGDLFRPDKAQKPAHKQARRFFDILSLLPQKHILHDTAIGLQLPELNGKNEWIYIAPPDETLGAFNRLLGDLFDPFNGLSLSHLNGHADAGAEIKASTLHMRGYGHPLTESDAQFYRAASMSLN
jgi:hypothetical protein